LQHCQGRRSEIVWQNLHARFTEHTGLATPPVGVWSTLMRKAKKQVPKYLASLKAERSSVWPTSVWREAHHSR
jgi:hypothetical protein